MNNNHPTPDNPNLGPDQQARHLKRDGWYLTDDGRGNHLLDPYKPSPEWETDNRRRHGRLNKMRSEPWHATYHHKTSYQPVIVLALKEYHVNFTM